MRKPVLFLVLAPGLFILGLGGWLFTEHTKGKQTWLAWKAQRIARDRFDWKELAPPEIPDSENFAMAPLIAGAVIGKDINPRFKALEPPKLDKEWGDWKEGRRESILKPAPQPIRPKISSRPWRPSRPRSRNWMRPAEDPTADCP